MRISDWSSDVCSSDLLARAPGGPDFSQQALTNPNGFLGVDGLFRLTPEGTAERTFAILPVRPKGVQILRSAPETRSEERRVGKECFSTLRSRWCEYN